MRNPLVDLLEGMLVAFVFLGVIGLVVVAVLLR